MAETNSGSNACAGCEVGDRRAFVQTALSGIAAWIGLTVADAQPLIAQTMFAAGTTVDASGAVVEARYPIPATDGVSIDTRNDVIIARVVDSAYAFALACPHQNTALRWIKKDNRFQCPKHQSRYKPSGEFISGRATRNMDRLPIKLDGVMLVVDTSREIRSDENAAGWSAAVVKIPA
ncbi:MAG: ubiquinol-cytochrome c reductase iron-sulfur subunit [Gemmatimonas sp.]